MAELNARGIAISMDAAIYLVIGFVIASVTCLLLLPLLRRFQIRQRAYEDAPASHQAKTGTLTMGGICFVTALSPLLLDGFSPTSPAIILFTLVAGCAAIGFLDDILAVHLGRNRGLRARTKFLLTALMAVIFLRMVDASQLYVPHIIFHTASQMHAAGVWGGVFVPHWLWFILGVAAITGTIHAVNLTDGLDGLAAGSMVFPLGALGTLALSQTVPLFTTGAWLGVGACLGFLIYNRYPAKLIMGDTGSLALGALLSGAAILTGEMLLLVVIGGVFVAEALSVILQVLYFKFTHGKRIFKMSPLHHHFELSGWSETKVTTRFWIASAICSAVGLAIVR